MSWIINVTNRVISIAILLLFHLYRGGTMFVMKLERGMLHEKKRKKRKRKRKGKEKKRKKIKTKKKKKTK